jgi:hypothetical protein
MELFKTSKLVIEIRLWNKTMRDHLQEAIDDACTYIKECELAPKNIFLVGKKKKRWVKL